MFQIELGHNEEQYSEAFSDVVFISFTCKIASQTNLNNDRKCIPLKSVFPSRQR
jgi:hypothetical protein